MYQACIENGRIVTGRAIDRHTDDLVAGIVEVKRNINTETVMKQSQVRTGFITRRDERAQIAVGDIGRIGQTRRKIGRAIGIGGKIRRSTTATHLSPGSAQLPEAYPFGQAYHFGYDTAKVYRRIKEGGVAIVLGCGQGTRPVVTPRDIEEEEVFECQSERTIETVHRVLATVGQRKHKVFAVRKVVNARVQELFGPHLIADKTVAHTASAKGCIEYKILAEYFMIVE